MLLAERDRQIRGLEADLAAAYMSREAPAGLPGSQLEGEADLRAAVNSLRNQLAEKESLLGSAEERLSRLEAVHRVAQVCIT